MELPAKVMAPGEAAEYLRPFLMDGEKYLMDGLAQSMDVAKTVGKRGAGEGRLFVTNARIIHWVEGTPQPWLYVSFADLTWVEQTDRDVPRFAIKNGMTQLVLHTTLPQGKFQFLANARVSRQLAADFPRRDSSGTSAGPTASKDQSGPDTATPEPQPSQSHQGQAQGTAVALPPVGKFERIPAKVASLQHTRVVDISTLEQRMASMQQVESAVNAEVGSARNAVQVGKVSETVVGEYLRLAQVGALPGFDPDLLMTAVALGVAVAQVERDAGWTETATIHPVVHTTLAMMGLNLGEEQGPGPGLVVDAAFNVARGTKFSEGVFSVK